jgi:FdhD protein
MEESIKALEITRFEHRDLFPVTDSVAIEEPLQIQIVHGPDQKKDSLSVTMRTPGHDKELAIGFLFTEGIVESPHQIIGVDTSQDNVVVVVLRPDVAIDQQTLSRNFYTTSSCGVCGKTSIESIFVDTISVNDNCVIKPSDLRTLPSTLRESQQSFQFTGGVHASGLFDVQGKLVITREDVGRHNALDKLIGAMLMSGEVPLKESVLLVSGRASFELVQKACHAGIAIVAAVGAPSSLAVDLALEKGITLIGFLKADRFNIYSHPKRVRNNE